MGHMILAAASPSPSSTAASTSGAGNYTFLIIIVALFALMYFVMIRPQRNRQRQMVQMQRGVEPGARVRTTAGMYATVVAVEDNDVVLEVAPGVKVRMLKRAIMEVVPDVSDEPAASAADMDEDAPPASGMNGASASANGMAGGQVSEDGAAATTGADSEDSGRSGN